MLEFQWFFSYFFPSIGFLLAVFLFWHILRSERSPSSTLAWLLAIFFIPYIAIPLFVMFGGRKTKKMVALKQSFIELEGQDVHSTRGEERLLPGRVHGIFPLQGNNEITLLLDGVVAYRELSKLLLSAQHSICITTFILLNDETGEAILSILTQKAKKGVTVRLLLDALGSYKISRQFLADFKSAGGQYSFFMPMLHIPFRGRANLRNHRKMVLVDQRVGVVGGMNLSRESMGKAPSTKRWRDLSFLVKGPILKPLYNVFMSDWKFSSKEVLCFRDEDFLLEKTESNELLQLMPSGPDVGGDPLHESIIASFFSATKRIWVVTPYFVPDEILMRSFCIAARRGIDVRVIFPLKSNHLLADLVRNDYLRDISKAGGTVFGYKPGMLHAKLIIIDDELAISGSANMDMRSLFLNYELAFFIHSEKKVDELASWTQNLMDHSEQGVKKASPILEVFEGVGRLFAPLV